MSGTRRSYNDEFKRQTVKYIQEQTKTVAELAQKLDIPAKTIHQWLGKYRQFQNEPVSSPEQMSELKRQLEEKDQALAKMAEEMGILKKAVHIFSNPKN
ncbi:transposase [Paenibacillus sp. FSL P4-0081]|uniref:transposase n=1 Tax=unclassified Paenibacillus TaxID=185978 RepID=UPI0004F91EA0|nr:transposase [Paenibacillus sp. FSL P4-0081]AIQ31572.1 transposase [Paenibacillus sp. FSL P4-0081]